MNHTQLIPFLTGAIKNRRQVLLVGKPGIGKTHGVLQACTAAGVQSIVLKHPAIDEAVDYKGLPLNVNGRAEFVPFGDLRVLIEATALTVCFIDDLGQASESVQKALMQLLERRQIGQHKISDSVVFIGATNRPQDAAGVSGMIAPLRNRWHSIVNIDADFASWKTWAVSAGQVHPEVVAFLSARPDILNPEQKATRDIEAFATPRSWEFVSNWLKDGVDAREVIQGTVGKAAGIEFLAWRDILKTALPMFLDVLKSPATAAIPSDPGIMFALTAKLAFEANKENFPAIGAYAARLPGEWRQLLMSDCTTRHPELLATKVYTSFACDTVNKRRK